MSHEIPLLCDQKVIAGKTSLDRHVDWVSDREGALECLCVIPCDVLCHKYWALPCVYVCVYIWCSADTTKQCLLGHMSFNNDILLIHLSSFFAFPNQTISVLDRRLTIQPLQNSYCLSCLTLGRKMSFWGKWNLFSGSRSKNMPKLK